MKPRYRPRGVIPTSMGFATTASGKRVRTRLYEVWASMRKRIMCPTIPDYPRYGGRGITICDDWRDDYYSFRAWAVTNGYRKGLTLDRIDSNGHYEPANCRWVPKADQQLNTRRVGKLTLRGVTKSLPEWSRLIGMPAINIRNRLTAGWTDEQTLTIPLGQGRPPEFHQKRGRKPRVQESPR